MTVFSLGRVCVKTAGRDSGLHCIIVDTINKNTVLVDGQTRRKKCNIAHLEPLKTVLPIEKNATHESVEKALHTINIVLASKTTKKAAAKKPIAKRKSSDAKKNQ